MFACELSETFKNTHFYITHAVAASELSKFVPEYLLWKQGSYLGPCQTSMI